MCACMPTEERVYTVFSGRCNVTMNEEDIRFSVSMLILQGLAGLRFQRDRKWSRYLDLRVFFLESQLQRVEGSNNIVQVF